MKTINNKKRISLLLIAAMLISIVAGIFASNGKSTFSDVPSSHWSYSYVERAAENGWVSGVGNGLYGVDRQVTYGELALMLGRSVYPELIDWYGGDPAEVAWYVPCLAVMAGMGLDNGTPLDNGFEEVALQPINRYNMAQILYNFLKDGGKVPSYNAAAVQASIGDWSSVPSNYQDALMAVVSASIITGVDSNGTFNGNGLMTRGQAAVVLCRMYDVFSGNGETTPTDPTTPGTSTGELGQKLPSGATAAAGVKSSIGKDDAYPTYGNSDDVSPNGYFTGATEVEIGEAQLVYDLLDMVNEAREAEGISPLKWSPSDACEEFVLLRAYELTIKFSHDRPNGGYAPGEVCTQGPSSSNAAFRNWMNSSRHKDILLDPGYEYMSAANCGNSWVIYAAVKPSALAVGI